MTAERILLIDDEPSLQLTVGDQLRMEGYEVISANTGEEALQRIRQTPPHLIILDISMPGMSGLTLLKKLSDPDGQPRYPILVFTARANMEPFFNTMNVEGFLAKTSDPTILASEVKRILRKHQKPHQPLAPATPGKKKMVVILEDDQILIKRITASLHASGYDAVAISDCRIMKETIKVLAPSVILIKAILSGATGHSLAAALADLPEAKGTPIILFDGSGIYKEGDKFINVDRFVASDTPADLLKAITGTIG
jgi:DNA-binding response OmpR family regulator